MEQRDDSLEGAVLASGKLTCLPPFPKNLCPADIPVTRGIAIFATGKARIA